MHPQRKIRNILLQPKTQIRYVYYLVGLICAPLAVFFVYIAIQFRRLNLELALSSSFDPQSMAFIEETLHRVSFAFAVALIVTVVAVAYGVILGSHRFVGPLYVINKYIENMKSGQFTMDRDLRKDDEMKDTLKLLKELGEILESKKK